LSEPVKLKNAPLRVAYLGPAATFSHEAALKKFGESAPVVDYIAVKTIADVFQTVEQEQAHFGIVPVENSIEGAVTYTLDMFNRSDLKIIGELELPIRQNLMVTPTSSDDLHEIRVVYSHPQSLGQCRGWLQENLKWAERQEVSSNVLAVEMANQNPHAAAIGGRLAAEKYGMRIIRYDLQDADFNSTRFLALGRDYAPRLAPDQRGTECTALLVSIKDRVGALHAVTNIMLKYDLNMTRIESRPSKQKAWDYLFYIEVTGHPQDNSLGQALAELEAETMWVKVLGAWSR
jgi:chorismate mutase/prephenate dehydratase